LIETKFVSYKCLHMKSSTRARVRVILPIQFDHLVLPLRLLCPPPSSFMSAVPLYTIHPEECTFTPDPLNLKTTLYTLHPTPYTLHHTTYTVLPFFQAHNLHTPNLDDRPPGPGSGWSQMQILIIHKLGFNQNQYTFSLILLIKIVLCSRFRLTKVTDYKCFHLRSSRGVTRVTVLV